MYGDRSSKKIDKADLGAAGMGGMGGMGGMMLNSPLQKKVRSFFFIECDRIFYLCGATL